MKVLREIGEKDPISIGTALPIETLSSSDETYSGRMVFVNIATVVRNYHGSYPHDQMPDGRIYNKLLLDEIETIEGIISILKGRPQVVFYLTNCNSLKRTLPLAKLKKAKTELQVANNKLFLETLNFVTNNVKNIIQFDSLIKGEDSKALMLTHYPLNLLSKPYFRDLQLLESHTGKIRKRIEWIHKLTSNESYVNIPFNILTIQVLGDKNKQFESAGVKIVKPFAELSLQNNWTPLTTMDKVRHDLSKLKDKEVKSILLEMSLGKIK